MDELETKKTQLATEIIELEQEKAECMDTMSQLIGTRGTMIAQVRELEEYITKLQQTILTHENPTF